MTYQQLTLDERYQVQALRTLGSSQADVARALRRHPSTISRELRRNSTPNVDVSYEARRAARAAHARRVEKGARSRKIQGALKELIEQMLHLSWSPEQISGRMGF